MARLYRSAPLFAVQLNKNSVIFKNIETLLISMVI